jgi:hypothetical protein
VSVSNDEPGRVAERRYRYLKAQASHEGDAVSNVEMELVGNTDAQTWAQEFARIVRLNPGIPTDEGTMIGWFANAIMSGYDEGVRTERKRGFDDRVREIAFQAAGAGSGAVMREAPDVVMPDREISEGVIALLAEFGIEGYARG